MRWSPRVTVAAVIERQGKFLVVEEKENRRNVISQPAGHLEKGESLHAAVIREVREETGWHFTPQALIGIYRWEYTAKDLTFVRFCYTGSVSDHDATQALDQGILRALWLSTDELFASPLRSPIVRLCVEDYLAGQRYPLSICTDIPGETVTSLQHT